ncbi:MAG: SUMF1/EgtB/PvdO family nonheme iron enzyme [Bacteroidia bacterium]|nr:SUMF1/EgtB/PvdO family nonheme iron enzyme [Bacteroidia bacterium]
MKPPNNTYTIHQEKLKDGVSFNMVFVEGDRFIMGDDEVEGYLLKPKPAHEVELRSYYIGQFPVTQALWEAVMRKRPSEFIGPDRPVEMVSWKNCQEFLSRINQQLGLTGIRAYRLPTESEWEFAARGGIYRSEHIFAGSSRLEKAGWFRENSHSETQPGGLLAPNELGLYDMSGNVLEWCEDWFDENYYRECYQTGVVSNPKCTKKGDFRVLRGGSWYHVESYCRIANRFRNFSYRPMGIIGFRLSRTAL